MTIVGKYSSTNSVRACLGLDPSDCPDELIVNSDLEVELFIDLDGWLETHETIYDDGTDSAATATQLRLKNLLVLYSHWFLAYEVAGKLMTFVQVTSDGKNQLKRFDVDLERVRQIASEKKSQFQAILDEEVNGVSNTFNTPPDFLSISTPTSDPVTNT